MATHHSAVPQSVVVLTLFAFSWRAGLGTSLSWSWRDAGRGRIETGFVGTCQLFQFLEKLHVFVKRSPPLLATGPGLGADQRETTARNQARNQTLNPNVAKKQSTTAFQGRRFSCETPIRVFSPEFTLHAIWRKNVRSGFTPHSTALEGRRTGIYATATLDYLRSRRLCGESADNLLLRGLDADAWLAFESPRRTASRTFTAAGCAYPSAASGTLQSGTWDTVRDLGQASSLRWNGSSHADKSG